MTGRNLMTRSIFLVAKLEQIEGGCAFTTGIGYFAVCTKHTAKA